MTTIKKEPSIPALAYILALAQFSAPFMFAGIGVTLPSIGLCFSLISTFFAVQVNFGTDLYFFVGILIFQGFGFAMFSSPNMAIIMNSVTPKEYGMASALSAQMRSLGMVLSMMIISIFMSVYIGNHMIDSHSVEFLSVMRYSFIIFTLFAAGGTYLSLMRFSKRTNQVPPHSNIKTKFKGR
jgi:MFS family permease